MVVAITVAEGLAGDTRLPDALAAVVEGTLTAMSPEVLRVLSPPFLGGSDAHTWTKRVLEGFVPALEGEYGIVKIDLQVDAS